ncbi:SDR family oxidoreductase [Planococcus halotolerans]|uniref:SDR family NAD(P)-dependent oxidoreductase n=1 Tax=Planococcus halotolerans TaxID=2233542 RepID=A0A365KQJ9_9BACL|nr:SDR family oxidoreductase [Planococcus halotolerans]QHJ69496.1 NAD(P)H-binding protein [Planococcus halotolerans]RAZ75446.1 SDR family NAD(P)-dependent oxidoreductase [Planococcus halotolerans]
MDVLVIGANGQVGRNIVKELAEKNHNAVAMVRKEEQKAKMEELGASKVVLADLEEDFSNAFENVDAVIFAAGSGPKTGPDKTLTIDLWGSVKAAKYAQDKGVKRFVQLGSMGSDNPDAGGEAMKPYLVAKRSADEILQATNLDYTIVRPGALTDDEKTGKVEVSAQGFESMEGRSIPRADVAHVLVDVLERENTYGKVFEILQGEEDAENQLGTV